MLVGGANSLTERVRTSVLFFCNEIIVVEVIYENAILSLHLLILILILYYSPTSVVLVLLYYCIVEQHYNLLYNF